MDSIEYSKADKMNKEKDFFPDRAYFEDFNSENADKDGSSIIISLAGSSHKVYGIKKETAKAFRDYFPGTLEKNSEEINTKTSVFYSDRNYFLSGYTVSNEDYIKTIWDKNGFITVQQNCASVSNLITGKCKLILCNNTSKQSILSINNYMEILCMNWLLLNASSFFLHAAGIVIDGNTHIFYGPPESGKSTVSRLADGQGHLILNDESVIISYNEDACRVRSSPFQFGDFKQNIKKSYPVKGLYRLLQAENQERNEITSISEGRAVTELLASTFFSEYYFNNYDSKIFSLMQNTVRTVPTYHLKFRKDETFLKLLEEQ